MEEKGAFQGPSAASSQLCARAFPSEWTPSKLNRAQPFPTRSAPCKSSSWCLRTAQTHTYHTNEPRGRSQNKTLGSARQRGPWRPRRPYLCHGCVILLGKKVSEKPEAVEADDRGHHEIAVRIKEKASQECRPPPFSPVSKGPRPKGDPKQNLRPLGVPGEEWLVFSSRQVS